MRVLLVLGLAPALALAQPAPPLPTPDSTSVPVDSVQNRTASPFVSWAVLRDSASARARQVEIEVGRPISLPDNAELLPPTWRQLGATGLTIRLPGGWDGPTVAAEEGLPGYALYTARNDADGHSLQGVVLRIERVTGLTPLLRERWTRGQTSYGYHGLRPVGPAAVPEGLGVEVAGPGRAGVVAFVPRGPALWTVAVEAPAATWASRRADVWALMTEIRLP